MRGKVEQFNDLTYVYLYISNVHSSISSSFFFSLVTVHLYSFPRLRYRAHDAHSQKLKSGLSPLQHFYYFLASPFQRSLCSLPIFPSILSPPSSSCCSILQGCSVGVRAS